MIEPEENQTPKGDATDFIDHQSEMDKAKNERIKSNQNSQKIESRQRNQKENETTKTDVSQKKTGGGKQVSPGT